MEERNLSVVLEEERETNKKAIIIIVLILTFLVIGIIFAYYASLNVGLGENVTEPIEPHLSPAILGEKLKVSSFHPMDKNTIGIRLKILLKKKG